MKKKILIFLCDQYPFSSGEFFIDDEMRVLVSEFERILIYTASAVSTNGIKRFLPSNAEVMPYSRQNLEFGKIKSIFRICSSIVFAELIFIMKTIPIKYWYASIKIMFVELHRSVNLKNDLIQLCKLKNVNTSDCLFYSYWHDYRALALALLREEDDTVTCVARAHGGDNFRRRFTPPYLPFKRFMLSFLTYTIPISNKGKEEFVQYASGIEKIIVSHLGKFNSRVPLFEKKDFNKIIIVSCSNLIADKRVSLIVDVISELGKRNVEWHHFGSGEQESYIKDYAKVKLKDCTYKFWGVVDNATILDFYSTQYVDLFINLSLWEGVPVSIMEALSSGIPVLATDAGGTSEIVNEQVGFLVPKDFSSSKIATIINNYLNLPISSQYSYRKNAYLFWKDNYDAEKNFKKFCNILRTI